MEFCCSCLSFFFIFLSCPSSSFVVHHLPCASSSFVHHLAQRLCIIFLLMRLLNPLCIVLLLCAASSFTVHLYPPPSVHHRPWMCTIFLLSCIIFLLSCIIFLLCASSSSSEHHFLSSSSSVHCLPCVVHQFPSLVRYLPSLCTIFLCASSSFSVHLRHRLSLVHHLLRCSIFLHRLPPVCIISLFSLLQGPALRKPHGIPHEARIVLWPSPSSLATRSPWPFLWPWPPYWHSVSLQRDRRCCWLLGQSRRREKNIKSITMVLILNNCRRKFSNAITTTEMAKLSQNDWYGVMCNLKNNDGVTIPCLWENSCMATKPRVIIM